MASRHTILLIQTSNHVKSRTFHDFETITLALDGLLNLFEEKLRSQNPRQKQLTYDINDLYRFIDDLPDLSALVFNQQLAAYEPHNKEWLKQKLLVNLRRQAKE